MEYLAARLLHLLLFVPLLLYRITSWAAYPFLYPIRFFERTLFAYFETKLHQNRLRYTEKTLNRFLLLNPPASEIASFKEKLETEADRVYGIVDRSIAWAQIKTATRRVIFTSLLATIIVGALGGFYGASLLSFVSPIAMAIVQWASTILTLPINYNQRVKGGMDTVYNTFEKALNTKRSEPPIRAPAIILAPSDSTDPNSLAEEGRAPAMQCRPSQAGMWSTPSVRTVSCPVLTNQLPDTTNDKTEENSTTFIRHVVA